MTPMTRRTTACTPTSYARLPTWTTHVVDGLLDRAARRGRRGLRRTRRRASAGPTATPCCPVDPTRQGLRRRGPARPRPGGRSTATCAEVREEMAVGHAGRRLRRPGPRTRCPRWPASEDVDRPGRPRRRRGGPRPGRCGRPSRHDRLRRPARRGRPRRRRRTRPEDHFVPPTPPPHARCRTRRPVRLGGACSAARCSWSSPTLFGLDGSGWAGLLALRRFVGGFVTLVARMEDRPPERPGRRRRRRRLTRPTRPTRRAHPVISETVEIRGHLIDSGVLSRVLDDILEYGGDYSIDTLRRRQDPADESYARLTVTHRGRGRPRPAGDAAADPRRQPRSTPARRCCARSRRTACSPTTSTRRPTSRPWCGSAATGCRSRTPRWTAGRRRRRPGAHHRR